MIMLNSSENGGLLLKKAIFLDRDGVINEVKSKRVKFVNRRDQFFFLPRVKEAIKHLSNGGYELFIVTNQGGVGLGFLDPGQLEDIHAFMLEELSSFGGIIKEVAACVHAPHAACTCRKPEAGMLLDLAERHGIDLTSSYMVGDREPDILAGQNAGCKTILISDAPLPGVEADFVFPDLWEASLFLVDDASSTLIQT